jgi:hypothetical protein
MSHENSAPPPWLQVLIGFLTLHVPCFETSIAVVVLALSE